MLSVGDLSDLIEKYTPKMETFMWNFQQRFSKDNPMINILGNDTNWIKSIPHPSSGPCFTYNPQMKSPPGYWYGIVVSLKRHKHLEIFLHEPNTFFYFKEEEPPNNIKIDLNEIKFKGGARIVGNYYIILFFKLLSLTLILVSFSKAINNFMKFRILININQISLTFTKCYKFFKCY